jgi:hypothetical protein
MHEYSIRATRGRELSQAQLALDTAGEHGSNKVHIWVNCLQSACHVVGSLKLGESRPKKPFTLKIVRKAPYSQTLQNQLFFHLFKNNQLLRSRASIIQRLECIIIFIVVIIIDYTE